jgi:hypothetical protein
MGPGPAPQLLIELSFCHDGISGDFLLRFLAYSIPGLSPIKPPCGGALETRLFPIVWANATADKGKAEMGEKERREKTKILTE